MSILKSEITGEHSENLPKKPKRKTTYWKPK